MTKASYSRRRVSRSAGLEFLDVAEGVDVPEDGEVYRCSAGQSGEECPGCEEELHGGLLGVPVRNSSLT